jgi:TRAP-type C4-dicarboxylate transport system permease small subunit
MLFILMLGVTTVNVVARFFFSSPIPSAVELGRYCFVGIIYLGSIYVMKEKGHIGLDMLVNKFSPKPRQIVSIGGQLLVIIFLAVFSFESVRMVVTSITVKSSSLGISMSIPYSAMVIGSVGMCIEAVINLVHCIGDKCIDPQTIKN